MDQLISKIANRAWGSRAQRTANDSSTAGRRKLLVVGVGSAGCAAAEWVFEDSPQASTLAVNTDRISLEIHKSETKLLLGARIFHGRGAQGHADAAERAAREAEGEIAELVRGFDIVAVLTALGGGTGTGAAHIVARVARGQGAAVVAVAVLPFRAERTRRERALRAFGLLKREAHTTILLDSEALLPVAGHLPMARALGIMDYFMAEVPRSLGRTLSAGETGEEAINETRALVLAGGVGTICYAEWGASGAETAHHHPLSQAAGGSPTAAIMRIDSHDGLAPPRQDALETGVANRLGFVRGAPPAVRVLVQRDVTLEVGGRAVSIVTGLEDPCLRRDEAPPVVIEPSRVSAVPSVPHVMEAAPAAPPTASTADAQTKMV